MRGPNLNEPYKGERGKMRRIQAQRGQKEDNSITPFNLASKVNGLLMSETVGNNMLKFSTSCFSPSRPSTHFWQLSCRLSTQFKRKDSLWTEHFWGAHDAESIWSGVKMDELGGKEQDVPFLWQPSDAESMGLHCTRCKTASATRFVHSKATRHRHRHGIGNTVRTQQSNEVHTQHGTAEQRVRNTRKLSCKRVRNTALESCVSRDNAH